VLGGRIADVAVSELGGVPYVTFAGDLSEDDLRHLANVSTAFALFAVEGDLLRPVPLHPLDVFDDDLLTILKYQGKTNETFTKLLLNVTVLASASSGRMLTDRLRVLDPLCGRGTTLNQALMYGWHASGLDVDERDFDAYAAFLPTWLKRKRLKHTADTTRLRREGKVLGRRFDAEIGISKEAWAEDDRIQVGVALVDTLRAREVFRPAGFDVVVTDAPYGVQHGSRAGHGLQRSPLDLITVAAPIWAELLRPGGAIGIAVNNRVSSRYDVLGALAAAGLEPVDDPAYRGFEHRVDQAIVRDIAIARRPG
jgi:SAM-dependent methyltransferase